MEKAHLSDGVEPISCSELWLGFVTSTDSGAAPSGGANDVGASGPGGVWLA